MRIVFEEQLAQLDDKLLVMGTAIEDAVKGAVDALFARDVEAAKRIVSGDDEINHLEHEIEGLCLRLLLTQQPVAADLRIVSGALRMVGDMERIGDQAAEIAEIVTTFDGEIDKEISDHLTAMGQHVCSMVHDAIASFVARDRAAARKVAEQDEVIDVDFDRLRSDIVAAIKKEENEAELLVDALMMAKYLERIGDHAENIAEWVEYSVTGQYKGTVIS